MSAAGYPFIDIAVHGRVKDHFAAGEALALFRRDAASGKIGAPLWANGPGARLFGFASIRDFLDRGPNGADIVYRQLQAAAHGLAAEGDRLDLTIRVVSGFQRVPVEAVCEVIEVEGAATVLLAAPAVPGEAAPQHAAWRMIEGHDDPDIHLAVLGAEGEVLAASPHFDTLLVSAQAAKMLVSMAGAETGAPRPVRRPIATAKGYLPAAIARLADTPARHFLIVVENVDGHSAAASELEFDPQERGEGGGKPDRSLTDALAGLAAIEDGGEPQEEISVETVAATPPAGEGLRQTSAARSDATARRGFRFRPDPRATRFVWKTDPEGRFSEVSGELAEAVGPRAAAINGETFADVAKRFHLDPDGRITALLAGRDTWSGKTIWWPVEGSALVIPIDLAALPTYTRDRVFDGFRGFGVVRIGDAAEDPEAIGLTIGSDEAAGGEAEADNEQPPAPDLSIEDRPGEEIPGEEEPAALRIAETPGRRQADRVVQLEERRSGRREGLTPIEQAAFREIARQLDRFADRPDRPGVPAAAMERSRDRPEPAPERIIAAGETGPAVAAATGAVRSAPERERLGLSTEIIDQMPVALLILAGERLIHGNPDFLTLSGYPSLAALEAAGGLDALLERQALADGASGVVVVRADGSPLPVTARLQSVRWDDQSALMLALAPAASGATAGSDDVSARQLRMEVEELRSILETATDGVVTIGAEGEIRSLNREASALFNYDSDEIRGKPFVTLFAHESQRVVLDYLAGLAGHGVASVLNDGREVTGREAGGGLLPLFMTIGRLASSNGYCAVIRDIAQWKRTEEELRNAKQTAEAANAHKSAFLAHVSHEIRTPLNAIIGFAEMMTSQRFGSVGHPRYIEYADDIGRSGRHVLDIVNDLLDISKIEAGEMELDFAAVDLNAAVSEAITLTQPQANGQRVIIRTALSQAVPDIVADPRSIRQIALNILSNAIRFTPPGGQIVVSTVYEANGSVVLRMRDTGIGMSRAELDLAMKPFRQVAGASSGKRGEGTGLGLPLTKAMVEANRAAFAISSAPNEGTLVEITFPSPRVLAT